MKLQLSNSIIVDTDDARVKNQGLRIAVIGESGSGKSWTIAVVAEQAIQQGLQVVFIYIMRKSQKKCSILSNLSFFARFHL